MAKNRRQIGGRSNKRGNRYEDYYATTELIRFAGASIDNGTNLRIKEQGNSPVDDLLVKEPDKSHYLQLKSGKTVSWTANKGKLKKEFRKQKHQCEQSGTAFDLGLVVARQAVHKTLRQNIPADLGNVTSIILFPILNRPTDIAGRPQFKSLLTDLCAKANPEITDLEDLAAAFNSAWADHNPNTYCHLKRVIKNIRRWKFLLRELWNVLPIEWAKVRDILNAIPDLSWNTNKGYLEWSHTAIQYNGIFPFPCSSKEFDRFMHRILKNNPSSFSDFEGLL